MSHGQKFLCWCPWEGKVKCWIWSRGKYSHPGVERLRSLKDPQYYFLYIPYCIYFRMVVVGSKTDRTHIKYVFTSCLNQKFLLRGNIPRVAMSPCQRLLGITAPTRCRCCPKLWPIILSGFAQLWVNIAFFQPVCSL